MQATWEAQFNKTPYEIIGATKDATEEELKAQYRKLVRFGQAGESANRTAGFG